MTPTAIPVLRTDGSKTNNNNNNRRRKMVNDAANDLDTGVP